MATNAGDNMDDFFDFAAMEHDHRIHDVTGLDHQNDLFCIPDDVVAMDWAADAPVTLCPDNVVSPQDLQISNTHEILSGSQATPQWPFRDVLDMQPPTSSEDMNTEADPSWPLVEVAAPIGNVTEYHETHLEVPPSSSYAARDLHELTGQPDEVSSSGHRGLRQAMAASPHDLPVVNKSPSITASPGVVIQARPTEPYRQVSTASWKPASAKRKGPQSRIPLEARQILEDEFAANPYPCSWEMDIIAHQANLDVKKVRNWYNNTRARKKGEGKSDPCFQRYYD